MLRAFAYIPVDISELHGFCLKFSIAYTNLPSPGTAPETWGSPTNVEWVSPL